MIEIIEDYRAFLESVKKRGAGGDEGRSAVVRNICETVRQKGDEALFSWTRQFDRWPADETNVRFPEEALESAWEGLSDRLKGLLILAKERIIAFQTKELETSRIGIEPGGEILGTKVEALDTVGLYVPGGSAAYPSSVLMNALPAVVAGVRRVVICTPAPDGVANPVVLGAAWIAGIREVYKIGGAQAIAAMAWGTKSIPKVDKITGPGNIYVALAKKEVFGVVGIDSIAGPSEILIVADDSARADWVAADLLSQAEHDPLAGGILITDSPKLAKAVKSEVTRLYGELSRKEILAQSLQNYSKIILVHDADEGIALANAFAPEHLELALKEPLAKLSQVKNAGAVFLGHYTPEALGDYLAGPNHVLPTGGTARFFSPLSVRDFQKRTSVLSFTESAFRNLAQAVIDFAEEEGLDAHARSVKERLK
ncbi:MAG: histidinol dehydrogenase [Fusobacteriaceae bacterium]|jgi:histidinol dehydrogenase|nr:histidinol dehydrogenase [Fusobacteriaceae bacterium]